MDPRHVVRIGTQIADALAATHTKGIIHRDLKPDNIFLVDKRKQADFIKILDFGIAAMNDLEEDVPRLTRHGTMLGTPSYMAPEQAEGKLADQRADIYSLGIILYEMTTGNVPFRNASSLAVLEMHRSTPPVPPRQACPELDIPPSLEQIILRGLRKELPERYQSMREIYNDLLTEEKRLGPIEDASQMMTVIDSKPEPDHDDRNPGQLEWLDDDVIDLDASVVEVIAEDEWSEDSESVAVTQLLSPRPSPKSLDRTDEDEEPGRTIIATPNAQAARAKAEATTTARSGNELHPPSKLSKSTQRSSSAFWRSPLVLIVTGFFLMAAVYGIVLLLSGEKPKKSANRAHNHAVEEHTHASTEHSHANDSQATNPAQDSEGDGTATPGATNNETSADSGIKTIHTNPAGESATQTNRRASDESLERRRPASPLEVQANSLWVRLDVQSSPTAVAVQWNGKKQGKTPITLRVPRGDREIKLTFTRSGYRTKTQRVMPSENRTLEIRMTKKPKTSGPSYAPTKRRVKPRDEYELF